MTSVLALVLVAFVVNPATGARLVKKSSRASSSANQSSELALQGVDCEKLAEITVQGVNVGFAVTTVCQVWPTAKWGAFPITGGERAKEIFEYGFGEGGLWDQMKGLAQSRGKATNFCWRAQTSREFATCDESMTGNGKDYIGCQWRAYEGEPCINWQVSDYPWVGDHSFCRNPDRSKGLWCFTKRGSKDCDPVGSERIPFLPTARCYEEKTFYSPKDMPGQARSIEPTEQWCQKRCSMVSGCEHFSYWGNDGGCHLQDASAKNDSSWFSSPVAGPPSCSENQVQEFVAESFVQVNTSDAESAAISKGCQVFTNGQCYGSCPSGFQPSTLLQFFAPVCSSRCAGSSKSFGCGFGCADTAGDCLSTTMGQVTQVVGTVGKVAAYMTGNQVVHKVVEKIIELVEFILTSFWMMIRLGKELWVAYKESESISAFISIFVAFIMENAGQINQNVETLVALFGDVVSFWLEMVQEGFKVREAPLTFITETMNKFGEQVLDSAFGLVAAFVYPKCET